MAVDSRNVTALQGVLLLIGYFKIGIVFVLHMLIISLHCGLLG
jgi:hypothetical protein